MATYSAFIRCRFELTSFYDRPVASANRIATSWDFLLTSWQIRRGSVELFHAGGRIQGTPGDWLLIPPGLARRHRFTDDAEIRSIRCQIADASGQPPGVGWPPRILHTDPTLQAAADALGRDVPRDQDLRDRDLPAAAWAGIQGALITWCTLACERLGIADQPSPTEPRVAAARRLLLARRSPAALPWGDLRRATGLSRPHLDRLFRQHCGRSVRAWSEDRLLAEACTALADPADPVKAVAMRLGFGDDSHFCRWFRQRTGTSPAAWRKNGGV